MKTYITIEDAEKTYWKNINKLDAIQDANINNPLFDINLDPIGSLLLESIKKLYIKIRVLTA